MQETTLSKTDKKITNIELNVNENDTFGFNTTSQEAKTFNELCTCILQCGRKARENQKLIHRSFKEDGSILTETDLAVSNALIPELKKLYPDSNIVTEEIDLHEFNNSAKYTFILDPIDGTDAYSQGFPSWCIALGILDSNRIPCGGVIFAPRFGIGTEEMFFCSPPYAPEVYLNGKEFKAAVHYDIPRQITTGSDILNHVDLNGYGGKLRIFGSGILHMAAPFAYSNIDGCLTTKSFAWDVAAPHALALKLGMQVKYIDGSEVIYDNDLLIERKRFVMPILVGYEPCVDYMKNKFSLL